MIKLKSLIELNTEKNSCEKMVIITSLYCYHCVDLLPELNKINQTYSSNIELILLTDATSTELEEMLEFFQWEFNVIKYKSINLISEEENLKLPFLVVFDSEMKVINKGTIYNERDLNMLMINKIIS